MRPSEKLQTIGFNPDCSFVNVGTTEGFRILSADSEVEVHSNHLREKGNILKVQNLSNLVVYIRGGDECPGQELYVYDDDHDRDATKLYFHTKIKDVKLSLNCILVILEKKTYLFQFNRHDTRYKEPVLLKKFRTIVNTNGIGCLYSYKERNVVILPGKLDNHIQIYDSLVDHTYEYDIGTKPTVLAGNIHGEVFAYADANGNEIKLHKIVDGELYKTFERGKGYIEITSIAFDKFCLRMAVASKKETIHVFSLPKELALNGRTEEEFKEELKFSIHSEETEEFNNKKSLPASLLESRVNDRPGFFGKYVWGSKSEKSYLKIYINHPEKTVAIVGNKLKILTNEGKLYSIDVQTQGAIYEESAELTSVSLIKNDINRKE